jgi:hypothetical protein
LQLEAGPVELVLYEVFGVGDLGAPGEEVLGVRGLILAAHRDEVPCLGPAVRSILAQAGDDRALRVEGGQLVPEGVELGVGDLALAVVVEVLMLPYEALELRYPRAGFFRHCPHIVRRGARRCQT